AAPIVQPTYQVFHPQAGSPAQPAAGPTSTPQGLSPTQVLHAYGIDGITFQSNGSTVQGDGTGQTIAIVDAYDDPSIVNDLAVFAQQFILPAPPSFTKVGIDANGNASTTAFPTPNQNWAGEIELDVEWAHAIAPKANILLVEANDALNLSSLLYAIDYARNY